MITFMLVYIVTALFNVVCLYLLVQKHKGGKYDMSLAVFLILMLGFLPIGSAFVAVLLILIGLGVVVCYMVEKMLTTDLNIEK